MDRSPSSCTRPVYGQLAQTLGGHLRFKTAVPPRLSEFAILCTAKFWRAQYEWFAHVPQAERAGVKTATIRDIHAGRVPKSAPKDERAIYDFIQELYKTRRVSDKNYKRVNTVLGNSATVEFVGILGYYVHDLDDPRYFPDDAAGERTTAVCRRNSCQKRAQDRFRGSRIRLRSRTTQGGPQKTRGRTRLAEWHVICCVILAIASPS